ncbi:MAG: GntR family transcriptional regulator [Candidatus Aminicenantes bacterium]|nr:GntR family transcriptional regulator [Candidatus Aminicenantes bacterium]
MIKIDPTSFIPLYEQVKSGLRREIALGALKPGAPLPSIRDLAARLLINPNTVARAYADLERERLITTRKGKGCFVSEESGRLPGRDILKRLDGLFEAAIQDARRMGAADAEIRRIFEDRLGASSEERGKWRSS